MSSFFRRRNSKGKVDDTRFLRNGAILLEQLITSGIVKQNPIRSFSAEELKLATNNYGAQKISPLDPNYILCKGFLQSRPVIVMKYIDQHKGFSAEEHSFNNIVFTSHVYHKNVLKLIGCCLETEPPLLVFESVKYGTLHDWIYSRHQPHLEPLILRQRLKIAMEIARAVAFLHFGFDRPIVFRDIKPTNILLDEHYVPKLFNFSLSKSIPKGETHINTGLVVGTYGFMAPEYIFTGECNEKSDVYSFGSLLLVLLTGRGINDLTYLEQGNDYTKADYIEEDDCTKADYIEEDDCAKAEYVEEDDSTKADNVEADDCTQADSVEDDDCTNVDYVEEDDCTISGYVAEDDCRVSNSLFYYLKKHIDNNTFNEIVDPMIVGEASFPEMQRQLQDFIQLICKCVNRSTEDRPTMIDVAKQLRQIYLSVV